MTKYLGIHRVLLLTTILAVNAYAMKQDPAEWDDAVKSKAIDMLTAGQSKDDVAKYLVDQDFDASVKANPVTYKAIQDWLQTLTKNPKVNEVADVQFMLEKTAGGKKQDPNKSLGDVFASIKNKIGQSRKIALSILNSILIITELTKAVLKNSDII